MHPRAPPGPPQGLNLGFSLSAKSHPGYLYKQPCYALGWGLEEGRQWTEKDPAPASRAQPLSQEKQS